MKQTKAMILMDNRIAPLIAAYNDARGKMVEKFNRLSSGDQVIPNDLLFFVKNPRYRLWPAATLLAGMRNKAAIIKKLEKAIRDATAAYNDENTYPDGLRDYMKRKLQKKEAKKCKI